MVYANFGKRFVAYLIDSVILYVIGWLCYLIMGYYGYGLSYLVAGWLYFALMESSEKQATLGKMAMSLTVTDLNGQRITFGKATGRYFGKFISSMILGIGYLMAAFTERSQALHDMMAGTLVLEARQNPYAYQPQPQPQPAYAGAAPAAGPYARPTLYGLTGDYSGRSIPVDDRGVTMGRDSAYCQVAFSGNAQGISRRHCTVNFNRQTGTFLLTDVGSTYGTYLESGMKVIQGQAVNLRPGERFYLADRNNMFELRI